jgi:hypothetical protein
MEGKRRQQQEAPDEVYGLLRLGPWFGERRANAGERDRPETLTGQKLLIIQTLDSVFESIMAR